ncbi:MAG: HD domain-containing protein [Alphaproteobacteria bacterium]|nr:HD domain-containing protein [Alphaproteobacteria bacterium]
MADFFENTREIMAKVLQHQINDEQVKAFLHYTETGYKKNGYLLPIFKHRKEYEGYSTSLIYDLRQEKLDVLCVNYTRYKKRQEIRGKMAKYFEEVIFPKIQNFEDKRQSITGYHGLEHSEGVGLRALDIAISLGYERKQDLVPVLLAAAIHDCARTDNSANWHHGPEAAEMPDVQRLLDDKEFNLSPAQKESVKNAARVHTVAQPYDGKSYDYVQKCLCDADRIRLSWERGHSSKFFFTKLGDELGDMNPYRVDDYLHGWDYIMKKFSVKPLAGPLADKYAIVYNRDLKRKSMAFVRPRFRGNVYGNGNDGR